MAVSGKRLRARDGRHSSRQGDAAEAKPAVPLTLLPGLAMFFASRFGQAIGAITGVVKDPSQARIPGVTVTATNTATEPSQPNGPQFSINSEDFGTIASKGNQSRNFQGQLRFQFWATRLSLTSRGLPHPGARALNSYGTSHRQLGWRQLNRENGGHS
jgi:hypothetical protein